MCVKMDKTMMTTTVFALNDQTATFNRVSTNVSFIQEKDLIFIARIQRIVSWICLVKLSSLNDSLDLSDFNSYQGSKSICKTRCLRTMSSFKSWTITSSSCLRLDGIISWLHCHISILDTCESHDVTTVPLNLFLMTLVSYWTLSRIPCSRSLPLHVGAILKDSSNTI